MSDSPNDVIFEEGELNLIEPEKPPAAANPQPVLDKDPKGINFSQWALAGNDKFLPIGQSVKSLPDGVYEGFSTQSSIGIERVIMKSDGIYHLPEMATETVLADVQSFWASEEKYRRHSLLFKRGLLLYGPAGSGKTATLKLLMTELIKRGGIVLLIWNVSVCIEVLKAIRRIEPDRHLIALYEDIDEIIRYNGESAVLSMLDGEHNVDRILNLATTNHPDQLGARIINRPSRFDRAIYVGMPGAAAREHYLIAATEGDVGKKDIKRWVRDTDGLSIAHLRELVAAVYCLNQPYEDVLKRLHNMFRPVKELKEFKQQESTVGFSKSIRRRVNSTERDFAANSLV